MSKQLDLYLSIGSDLDPEQQELVVYQLADEIREASTIELVEIVPAGAVPAGTKGGPDIGAILIKVAEVGGITDLIAIIGSWLGRDRSRTLKLQLGDKSIEVTGISKAEQTELVEWFRLQAGYRLDK
jgi:hypothetical protein